VIVWVASFPRSGNNLCSRQTLRAVFRAKTGAVQNLDSLLPRLSLDGAADPIGAMREHDETIFLKTHRVVDARDPSPAIYIVRDGRDSLVSYAHFVEAQREPAFASATFEEALATLIEREDHDYGSWSGNVRAWTNREAPTEVIRFEELILDPVATVRAAAESLGVRLRNPAGEPPDFERLRKADPGLYRRGKAGSWKAELPPKLEERFWQLHGAEMEALGYSRE
jgi:sulfotransferase family protein